MYEECPICKAKNVELKKLSACQACTHAIEGCAHLERNFFTPSSLCISRSNSQLSISQLDCPRTSHLPLGKRRKIREYYKSLNAWIEEMNSLDTVEVEECLNNVDLDSTAHVRLASYLSFFINIVLMVMKAFALMSSGSYTILSSLADSCLDILAGLIMAFTAHHTEFRPEDKDIYPIGKSRIQTVGILVFAILMLCCSAFIMKECLVSLILHENPAPVTHLSIHVMKFTVIVKLLMWIVYHWIGHPITLTLAEDHRNDVFTNTFGMIMYFGGEHWSWWMDSAGGLIISAFVFVSWFMNARENFYLLSGKSCSQDIIRRITYIAAHHHPFVKGVDQVIAVNLGVGILIEVHIILPSHLPVEVAQWIRKRLESKLGRLEDVEKVIVHIDVEPHNPNEHLINMIATGKVHTSSKNQKPLLKEVSLSDGGDLL